MPPIPSSSSWGHLTPLNRSPHGSLGNGLLPGSRSGSNSNIAKCWWAAAAGSNGHRLSFSTRSMLVMLSAIVMSGCLLSGVYLLAGQSKGSGTSRQGHPAAMKLMVADENIDDLIRRIEADQTTVLPEAAQAAGPLPGQQQPLQPLVPAASTSTSNYVNATQQQGADEHIPGSAPAPPARPRRRRRRPWQAGQQTQQQQQQQWQQQSEAGKQLPATQSQPLPAAALQEVAGLYEQAAPARAETAVQQEMLKKQQQQQQQPQDAPTTRVAETGDSPGRAAGKPGSAANQMSGAAGSGINGTAAVFDDSTSVYIEARGAPPTRLRFPVWWHGPIWSGTGYGSEATNYVLSLLRTGRLAPADLYTYHHGDNYAEHVVTSLSNADRTELEYLQSLPVKYSTGRPAIVVCHSVCTNWAYPEPMWPAGAPCPPNPREFGWVYQVGRTMFETDRLPALFVPRMNAMNEIWVPSEWQRRTFIASGVDASKLVVVPEGVNTTLFNPAAHTPLDLTDQAQLVFGRPWAAKQVSRMLQQAKPAADSQPQPAERDEKVNADSKQWFTDTHKLQQAITASEHTEASAVAAEAAQAVGADAKDSISDKQSSKRRPFVFISTFKWEMRKGWDVLLEAYLSEFSSEDDVELYILTKPFQGSGTSFKDKMTSWAERLRKPGDGTADGQAQGQSAAAAATTTVSGPVAAGAAGKLAVPGAGQLIHTSAEQQLPLVPASMATTGDRTGSQQTEAVAGAGASSPARHLLQHEQQLQQHSKQLQQQANPCSNFVFTNCSVIAGNGTSGPRPDELMQLHAWCVIDQIKWFVRNLTGTCSNKLSVRDTHFQQQQQQQQVMPSRALRNEASDATGAAAIAATANTTTAAADVGTASTNVAAAGTAVDDGFPTLYVVDGHISDADFPRFYKAGDAFVLPSRGEGWGRPHVEAMSMGLPVISTNWSGITAYLDDSVGYPIAVEKLVAIEGGADVIWWFKGLQWAQPSVEHLRKLMRHVYDNREEAAAKGAAARALMVEKYSPEAIADVLVRELKRIEESLP